MNEEENLLPAKLENAEIYPRCHRPMPQMRKEYEYLVVSCCWFMDVCATGLPHSTTQRGM